MGFFGGCTSFYYIHSLTFYGVLIWLKTILFKCIVCLSISDIMIEVIVFCYYNREDIVQTILVNASHHIFDSKLNNIQLKRLMIAQ